MTVEISNACPLILNHRRERWTLDHFYWPKENGEVIQLYHGFDDDLTGRFTHCYLHIVEPQVNVVHSSLVRQNAMIDNTIEYEESESLTVETR